MIDFSWVLRPSEWSTADAIAICAVGTYLLFGATMALAASAYAAWRKRHREEEA